MLALLIGACSAPQNPPAPEIRRLSIGVPESTTSEAEAGINQFVNLLSLEPLLYLDEAGHVVPFLASAWSWENDHRRLRIQLRPQVFLHDGRPLNAGLAAELLRDAVKRSLTVYPALSDVTSITADGDLHLLLELSQRSSLLPEDLAMLPLRAGQDGTHGTGPYRVVSRNPTQLILERFDRYHRGVPSIAEVEVKPSDTLRTSWTSLLRGELDVVSDVPADAVEFIRNDDVQVIAFARRYQYLIAFNSQKGPFRSPGVRKALNFAVDRNALIEKVLQGRGTPSTGPIWPKYWAYDASLQPYGFDSAQAAALLDDAGFPLRNISATAALPPARFRFTCLIPENFSVWERIALEVQKDLFKIGVDMQLRAVPADEFNRLVLSGEFEAALNDMVTGPALSRPYMFWRSARRFKGFNVFGYENAEFERLFEGLRASTNDAAVRSTTRRLQQVLLNDPPALFLAWNFRARAIRRDIVIPEAGRRDPLTSLSTWTLAPGSHVASGQ